MTRASFRRALARASLVTGLLLAAPLARAGDDEPGRHHGPPPIGHVMEKHAERLGLDATTLASIREIVAASQEESRPLRERMHALRGEMRGMLTAEEPDEAAIMTQVERLGAAEIALKKQRLRSMLRIRALLTPEQRAELVKIREERRAERRQRRAEQPPPDR